MVEMTKYAKFLYKFLGNNIAVDPGDPCHTEQSEVSLFCVVMRSFTYVQDDKFANNVNIGSTSILLLILISNSR